jgi:hypothetical protein
VVCLGPGHDVPAAHLEVGVGFLDPLDHAELEDTVALGRVQHHHLGRKGGREEGGDEGREGGREENNKEDIRC